MKSACSFICLRTQCHQLFNYLPLDKTQGLGPPSNYIFSYCMCHMCCDFFVNSKLSMTGSLSLQFPWLFRSYPSCQSKTGKIGQMAGTASIPFQWETWDRAPVILPLSYSGDRDQENLGSDPAWENSSRNPNSKKPFIKKRWWSGSSGWPWVSNLSTAKKRNLEVSSRLAFFSLARMESTGST
jgi:hypothetical protein